ncbi:hypothetical protein ACJX0J_005430, partial [Zea mays]
HNHYIYIVSYHIFLTEIPALRKKSMFYLKVFTSDSDPVERTILFSELTEKAQGLIALFTSYTIQWGC